MLNERAIEFPCAGQSLVGILHLPDRCADLGIVVVVGGPQYRVGSHRQFVQLARSVAAAGYSVLRFDARGMGDSVGVPHGFEEIGADIGAAVDALQSHAPEVRRVALWGLCDGASAALLYVHTRHDTRVAGVCAVNPWVRSEVGQARTQVKHYYARRVLTAAFWAKLLRGGVGLSSLRELARKLALFARSASVPDSLHDATFAERMARGCEALAPEGLLVILSENDYTAREFSDYVSRSPRWQHALAKHAARRCEIPGADHTLSAAAARAEVEAATVRWLADLCPLPRHLSSAIAEVA